MATNGSNINYAILPNQDNDDDYAVVDIEQQQQQQQLPPKPHPLVASAVLVVGTPSTATSIINNKTDTEEKEMLVVNAVVLGNHDPYLYGTIPSTTKHMRGRRSSSSSSSYSCCCLLGWCCGSTMICCCIILPLLMILLGYSIMEYGIDTISVATPIQLPIIDNVTETDIQKLSDDIDMFFQGMKGRTSDDDGIDDLIIPINTVNGFLQSQYPSLLRGNFYISVTEDECMLQTSLPINELLPFLPSMLSEHHYFVSTTDVQVDASSSNETTTVGTLSFDLGKKFKDDYDGPMFISTFLLYYQATVPTNKGTEMTTTTMTVDKSQYTAINTGTAASLDQNPFHHVSQWVMNLLSIKVFGQEQIPSEYDNNNDDVEKDNFLQGFLNGWDMQVQAIQQQQRNAKNPYYMNTDDAFVELPDISVIMNGIASISFRPGSIIVRAR